MAKRYKKHVGSMQAASQLALCMDPKFLSFVFPFCSAMYMTSCSCLLFASISLFAAKRAHAVLPRKSARDSFR